MLALATTLAGCSLFQESQKVDWGPFAANTAQMSSNLQEGPKVKSPVYTTPFIWGGIEQELAGYYRELILLLRSITTYSVQVSSIAQSPIPDSLKAQALARQIDFQITPVLAREGDEIGISRAQADSIVRNIARQQVYIDALRAADPFVEATVQKAERIFAGMRDAQRKAKAIIEFRIDSSFAGTMGNLQSIERTQSRLIRHYALLDAFRTGVPGALDTVLREDPSLRSIPGAKSTVSYDDIGAMEAQLVRRLGDMRGMREQLSPDWQYYQSAKIEIDSRISDVTDFIRQSRTAVAVWAQSHRNLVEGISVPPLLDLSAIAKGVVGKIVP
jgi:hypothetical protein